MRISDETVVLSLIIGVVLGLIYLLNKAIMAIFSAKKPLIFLLDFTFAAIGGVLTFIGALAISGGTIRFYQLALELLGAISVIYAVDGGGFFNIRSYSSGRIRKKLCSKRGKWQKKTENPKISCKKTAFSTKKT